MSLFLAQIKHKLISTQSEAFQELSSEIKDSYVVIKKFFFDTGFKINGYADLDVKQYFFVSKSSKFGDLMEMPISIQFVDALSKATDIEKQRVKKALKREDLVKFQMELHKILDNYSVEFDSY